MTLSEDRIYLQIHGERAIDEDGEEQITWCQDKMNDDDTEYIRADLVEGKMPCGHAKRYMSSADEGTNYCVVCELETCRAAFGSNASSGRFGD